MNAQERRKANQLAKKLAGLAAKAQETIDEILLLVADYQEFLDKATKECKKHGRQEQRN